MPTMTTTMPLLPHWLKWLWVAALCVVVALHLWHVWSMSGRARWWHTGHVTMAAGMITMFLVPPAGHTSLYWAGVVLFGAATIAAGLGAAMLWHRDKLMNWLWAGATVDMLAMTYMTLPTHDRDETLTYLFVAYLAVEVVIWLSNPLPRWFTRQMTTIPQSDPDISGPRTQPDPVTPAGTLSLTRLKSHHTGETCESMRLVADVTIGVRITLAVMSASMGWMLIAMQTMQATGMPMHS